MKIIDGWTFPVKRFTITASAGPNGGIGTGAVKFYPHTGTFASALYTPCK